MTSIPGSSHVPSTSNVGGNAASGVGLSGAAASLLDHDQQIFDAQLAYDTGLDPNVIAAWELSEQSGSAATYYSNKDFNDWLNIGQTGSGDYTNNAAFWKDPVDAANATALWLTGKSSLGWGYSAKSIQNIFSTRGQSAQAQINAIRGSGWAGSGYPELQTLYNEIEGKGGVKSTGNAEFTNPTNGKLEAPSSQSGGSSSSSGGGNGGILGTLGNLFNDATSAPGAVAGDIASIGSSLNPANAIAGVWTSVLSDAKYAALFLLTIAVGGFLIVKGLGSNGAKMPAFVALPAAAAQEAPLAAAA